MRAKLCEQRHPRTVASSGLQRCFRARWPDFPYRRTHWPTRWRVLRPGRLCSDAHQHELRSHRPAASWRELGEDFVFKVGLLLACADHGVSSSVLNEAGSSFDSSGSRLAVPEELSPSSAACWSHACSCVMPVGSRVDAGPGGGPSDLNFNTRNIGESGYPAGAGFMLNNVTCEFRCFMRSRLGCRRHGSSELRVGNLILCLYPASDTCWCLTLIVEDGGQCTVSCCWTDTPETFCARDFSQVSARKPSSGIWNHVA